MRTVGWLFLCVACACGERPARTVRVGSKAFTESVILGEIAAQMISAGGENATHRRELGGTRVLWDALNQGELDIYPEYTGTLRAELLPGLSGASDAQLREVLRKMHLQMSPPLGFQNTYAIGMRRERAEALGIRTLSDLASHPELRLGFSNEFIDRADGWPGLKRRYGFKARARGLDHPLAYRALRAGELDAIDLYSTDPEIQRDDLRVLEDDRHHFPQYAAVYLYRDGLPRAAKEALLQLGGRITQDQMIRLNVAVELEHQPEAKVAATFLREQFGVRENQKLESRWERFRVRTGEHLVLVGISLGLAVALAIPAGVLAARRRVLGQALLTLTGIIQTIPSLALLVFMIPLLGIGTKPAIVALFLYSLLPILRGTYTGLTTIPQELEDSAEALGLPPRAKLLRIELPLAAPSILSGIKTAAVINVGTATLGALIGAGGYGQPILTGIRLQDVGLILEGAVPSAVLAVLVQFVFDGIERWTSRSSSLRSGG